MFDLWQRRFGGDARVIGRTFRMNGERHSIVGILSRDADLSPRKADMLIPMSDADLRRESSLFRGAAIKLVTGDGAALVLVGLVAGLGLAYALTRLLYEVSTTEAATLALTSVLLGAIGLVATWFPAWRAAPLNPVSTLRTE